MDTKALVTVAVIRNVYFTPKIGMSNNENKIWLTATTKHTQNYTASDLPWTRVFGLMTSASDRVLSKGSATASKFESVSLPDVSDHCIAAVGAEIVARRTSWSFDDRRD